MPPVFALLLCSIFVIFLLRLDYKQAPDVSRYLWIASIWALVAFSKPLGIWFGNSEEGTMEFGSPLDRVFHIILLCLAILVLVKRKLDLSSVFKKNLWLVIVVGFMLVSILWSSIPYISFKRWTREAIAVVMALMVASEHDPRQALLSILRRISYILIPFSLLLIKYYPRYGVEFNRWSGERMWIGVALQKNGLASLCIISALFLIWTLYRRKRRLDMPVARYQTYIEIFLLVVTFSLFLGPKKTLAYSATSTAAFVAAMLALLSLYFFNKQGLVLGKNVLKVIIVIIVFYGTITPFLGKLSILDISSVFGRDETVTGRAYFWATLSPLALSRPILGHGVGGFWTTQMRHLTSSNAHNGYLDVLLNLGFVGGLLVLLFLLSCCEKARRVIAVDFDLGVLFVCYLILVPVHNIAESSINSFTTSLTAIILFFSVSSLRVTGK